MKTPLPARYSPATNQAQEYHNQMVSYLTELTEVVEGKPCRHCEVAEEQGVTHIHTPTLKEQLLGAMPTKVQRPSEYEYSVNASDAFKEGFAQGAEAYKDIMEAIINRIIK
jgi:hypothetical protein